MARGNPGVNKLLSIMRKMIQEVNDQEICRRLDILMHTEKEDLPSQMVRRMLDEPELFDPSDVPEPYTQYVKHYLYMIKRAQREQKREDQLMKEKGGTTRKSSAVRKKAPVRSKSVAGKTAARRSSASTGAKKKAASSAAGARTARTVAGKKKASATRSLKKKKTS